MFDQFRGLCEGQVLDDGGRRLSTQNVEELVLFVDIQTVDRSGHFARGDTLEEVANGLLGGCFQQGFQFQPGRRVRMFNFCVHNV